MDPKTGFKMRLCKHHHNDVVLYIYSYRKDYFTEFVKICKKEKKL